ncbi:MAG TPA: CBS domain-containing protein [Spirochaetia bacterium]|nr:CBS domain-containing protein [Spirochaetia bacterium]
MPFLSELIGKPVTDLDGERIGRLADIVASKYSEIPHPEVVAISVQNGGAGRLIPFSSVAALQGIAISINRRAEEINEYAPSDHDLFLARDVLDRQIIDTNDVRVVRVNDIEITRARTHYFVANVDIGGAGLLRRLGFLRAARLVRGRKGAEVHDGISWENVELLSSGKKLRLKVPGSKITDLHPADLAEIISDLGRLESAKLLDALDVQTVADTLESVEPEFQASLIESLDDEKAADVLEAMAPDEAADLLGELPEARSRDLLNLMKVDDAEDVRKLLSYPEDTAGGIMTTDYSTVPPGLTASQAMTYLREHAADAETLFYVFVVDAEGMLHGVFSLRELVMADPGRPVRDFRHDRFISVKPEESQTVVAQIVAKYNLLAVPVVDDDGRIHGIVTADDALDKIIPTSWKKHLPRLYS